MYFILWPNTWNLICIFVNEKVINKSESSSCSNLSRCKYPHKTIVYSRQTPVLSTSQPPWVWGGNVGSMYNTLPLTNLTEYCYNILSYWVVMLSWHSVKWLAWTWILSCKHFTIGCAGILSLQFTFNFHFLSIQKIHLLPLLPACFFLGAQRKPPSGENQKANKHKCCLCENEARARTIQYIERFLGRNEIPFNVMR